MRKIREVLRLVFFAGLELRKIARSLSISHATAASYLAKAQAAGLSWMLPDHLDDGALERLRFPKPAASSASRPMPDWEYVHRELRKKGVTRILLSRTNSTNARAPPLSLRSFTTTSGKTYIACALGQKACREGFGVVYRRTSRLLAEILQAKADLLILDDWRLYPLDDEQRRDMLEIMDGRHLHRSTPITCLLPVEKWHEMIGDGALADTILDRLVHNAHKIKMKGESMRKRRMAPKNH